MSSGCGGGHRERGHRQRGEEPEMGRDCRQHWACFLREHMIHMYTHKHVGTRTYTHTQAHTYTSLKTGHMTHVSTVLHNNVDIWGCCNPQKHLQGENQTSQIRVTRKSPHDSEMSRGENSELSSSHGYLRAVRLWLSCVTSPRLSCRMVRIVTFRDDDEHQVAGPGTTQKRRQESKGI